MESLGNIIENMIEDLKEQKLMIDMLEMLIEKGIRTSDNRIFCICEIDDKTMAELAEKYPFFRIDKNDKTPMKVEDVDPETGEVWIEV